jgi:hypothetical protein
MAALVTQLAVLAALVILKAAQAGCLNQEIFVSGTLVLSSWTV